MKKRFLVFALSLAVILSLASQAFAYYTVPSDTVVYVTETGSCYHRWGCASLKSVAASYTVADATYLGYYGCSHCDAAFTTGVHTPTPSSSSSSSNSTSSTDVSLYLKQAEALDEARSEVGINTESDDPQDSSKTPTFVKVICFVLLAAFLLPIIVGTIATFFAAACSAFRKKRKPLTDEDGKELPF